MITLFRMALFGAVSGGGGAKRPLSLESVTGTFISYLKKI